MAGASQLRKSVRYAFIDELIRNPPPEFIEQCFTVEEYCFHLKVSRSGFYKWRTHREKPPAAFKSHSDDVVMSMVQKFLDFTPEKRTWLSKDTGLSSKQ